MTEFGSKPDTVASHHTLDVRARGLAFSWLGRMLLSANHVWIDKYGPQLDGYVLNVVKHIATVADEKELDSLNTL